MFFAVLKFVNLQYNTLVGWADGTNDLLTKRLMIQVLFFFSKKLANSLQKPFHFFYKITKMKINSFECPKSIRIRQSKIIIIRWLAGPMGQMNR